MLELSSAAHYSEALHRDTLAATALAESQVEEFLKASYEDPRLFDPDGGDDVPKSSGRDPTSYHVIFYLLPP